VYLLVEQVEGSLVL